MIRNMLNVTWHVTDPGLFIGWSKKERINTEALRHGGAIDVQASLAKSSLLKLLNVKSLPLNQRAIKVTSTPPCLRASVVNNPW
jgi:hypothetical protein